MLEGHTRPFDWEQEVLLRCQRWMVQQGYSLEQAFSLIAGGSRSGISRKRFGEWILQIDPLLYLEHVDRIFNKFKLADGEVRAALSCTFSVEFCSCSFVLDPQGRLHFEAQRHRPSDAGEGLPLAGRQAL